MTLEKIVFLGLAMAIVIALTNYVTNGGRHLEGQTESLVGEMNEIRDMALGL
ncbi:MAG: hypothetical protein AAGI50_15185 [Pseudomonadota bacterium]